MIFFLVALFIIVLVSLRKNTSGVVLSREATSSVNAIFAILIFLSHSVGYIENIESNYFCKIYTATPLHKSQFVVTTYLAFSGYGCIRQVLKQGETYVKKFPVHRILKTLFYFDAAVVMYLIVNLILGNERTGTEILGSFIGLTTVGNSNWYMFAILSLYCMTYIAVRFTKDEYSMLSVLTGEGLMYVAIASMFLPGRFYNTVLCYVFGAWVAVFADKIKPGVKERIIIGVLSVLGIVALAGFRDNQLVYNFVMIFFVAFVMVGMSFVSLKSVVLDFMGKHTFSFFILQRISFMVMERILHPNGDTVTLFLILSFIMTILIAVAYDTAIPGLWNKMEKAVTKSGKA